MNYLRCGSVLLFLVLKNKRRSFQNKIFTGLLLLTWLLSFQGFAQTTQKTFTASGTATVPAGVTTIAVEAWGGGGGGGGVSGANATNRAGGGGGGGAYVLNSSVSVTPNASITITVGSGGTAGSSTADGGSGGSSSFVSGSATVTANGGGGGKSAGYNSNGNNGTGGAGATGTWGGGTGGTANNYSGGGGGGAGATSAGSASTNQNGGTGGSGGGLTGANGRATNTGTGTAATATYTPTLAVSGGGSGGRLTGGGTTTGGAGAAGYVRYTYTLPAVSNFSATAVACSGNQVQFMITSTTLQNGSYTVTYYITGTANSEGSAASPATTTLNFASGTGSIYTTNVFNTAETDQLHITRITDNATNNYTDFTNNTNFTISDCNSWYSYQTGSFSNWNSWTLDPSGSTRLNGLHKTPGANSNITILSGKTITYAADASNPATYPATNSLVLSTTTINAGAILDMAATTGNALGTVTGQGTLRVKGTGLPITSTTYNDFILTTGGTVEYYDANGTMPTAVPTTVSATASPVYNNLMLTNSTGSNVTFVEGSNLTVNGTFTVGSTTGTNKAIWQINDNNPNQRTVTLNGDLVVNTKGAITVLGGTAGTPHAISMYGDFTNNGIVQFFDPTIFGANLYTSSAVLTAATSGKAANVTFISATDQTVTLNSQTDFYRFIVNKGSSQTPTLTVYSPDATYTSSANNLAPYNMKLWGPANLYSTGYDVADYSNCALSIRSGTLQLTGTVTIPTLIENATGTGAPNDVFTLPQSGALWLNGSDVNVTLTSNAVYNNNNTTGNMNDDQRLAVNGLFRVSSGATFNGGTSRGIGAGAGGTTLIEGTGTTVSVWQYRPISGSGTISLTQTGGTFNVGYGFTTPTGSVNYIDNITEGFARFDLLHTSATQTTTNGSFTMTGGVMNVARATDAGGFMVGSSSGNYSVTGGTINFYIDVETGGTPTSGGDNQNFKIQSTAPLYNVNVHKTGGATTDYAQLSGNDLVILNDFTLVNGTQSPTFNCNNLNLTVGGNFNIQTGTAFNLGATGTSSSTTTGPTITFSGSGTKTWTYDGTISNLVNVVINKSSSGSIALAGSKTIPNITGTPVGLTLTAGTLNDGGKTITVTNALSNSATHTGTVTGSITYTATGTPTIGGANGTFGNLILAGTASATIATQGNQTVTGNLKLNGATQCVLNISSYNLTVDTITTSQNFSNAWCIQTNGLQTAGGLTRKGVASGSPLLFPVATIYPATTGTLTYTPNTITVTYSGTSGTTTGYITVSPVNNRHITIADKSGDGNIEALNYYWHVASTGYTSVSAVNHDSYTYTAAMLSGTTAEKQQYRTARYDNSTNGWSYNTIYYNATAGQGTTTMLSGTVSPGTSTTFNANGWYNVNTHTAISYTKIDGDYTCGNSDDLDKVITYYSVSSGVSNYGGTWKPATNKITWDTLSNAGVGTANIFPCATCPVIIGDGSRADNVIINTDASCAKITINANAVLDCGTNTGNSINLGISTDGTGTLRVGYGVNTSPSTSFPNGDFSDFLGQTNGGTVEFYGAAKVIPSTYTAPNGTKQILNYYNLVVNPNSGQTITMADLNLTVYNNFTTMGGTTVTPTANARTYTFGNTTVTPNTGGNINVNSGTFQVNSNTAATSATFIVVGNTTIANGATMQVQSGGTGNHTFSTQGSITNNGTLNLKQSTTRYMNLAFTGNTDATIGDSGAGTSATTLSNVTVNKGTSNKVICSLSGGFTTTTTAPAITTGTNGVGNGWLILQNGTFDFANINSSSISSAYPTVSTTLSAASWAIPSTAKLRVSGANVTVNTTATENTANDLFLSGTLEVVGGIVNVDNANNTTGTTNDVDIEYGTNTSPNPTINVSGGNLWVRSSIRRSTSTLTGVLVYNQTGGAVTVGGIASSNARGVFEIDKQGAGSQFNMTGGGSLTVQRQVGGSIADVYINPATSSVDATSTINVGLGSLTSNTNFKVNIVPAIGNFAVNGGTNVQTVNLYHDLTLEGGLTINSPSSLLTTAVTPNADVTIGGDFNCLGSALYNTGGSNTTTFNGTAINAGNNTAVLTANTDFYDVVVDKQSGTLAVSGTAPIATKAINNLSITSGTLSINMTGNESLKVNRNITINGTQTGASPVEVYTTTNTNTITSTGGTGTFTNLTLGGTATSATVDVKGNLTIIGTLKLLNGGTSRYLNIASSQLTFGSAASVSNASSNAFILTNGVASDLGVVKNWATGTNTFNYAVGTPGAPNSNYTPVSYTLNVQPGGGTLTVVPVANAHNTAITRGTTDKYLKYYWTVKRSSDLTATTVTSNFTFGYLSSMIGGTTGTLTAAYLDPDSNPLGWTMNSSVSPNTPTITGTGTTASTTQMSFDYNVVGNLPPAGSYYDYSAGTSNTLPNPIKGLYSRKVATVTDADGHTQTGPTGTGGGNWTISANWTYETDGDPTNAHPGSIYSSAYYDGPYGVPVTISPGTQINLDEDGAIAYKTTINGTLYNTTAGHNLGTILGTGTLKTTEDVLPAGTYDAFVASSTVTSTTVAPLTGGTIEYAGTTALSLDGSYTKNTYNNIVISNTNTVTVAANDLTINGTLTVNSGSTLDDSQNAANLTIAKDFSNGGTFLEGTNDVSITGNLKNSPGATFTDVSGTITLLGDLSNGGTFSEGTGNLNIAGSLINTSTFNAGTGTVTFNSASATAQTVSGMTGTSPFNNLTMNNTGAGLTLNSPTTVNGVLTMTSGNINSISSTLALSSTATASGGSANSYVYGPMTKVLSSGSFTAPVGGTNASVNLYRPVTIAYPSASDTWNFQYFGNNPTAGGYPNSSMNTSNILTVSQFEYWVVSPNLNTTSGDLTLTYGPGSYLSTSSFGIDQSITNLRVAHWNGAPNTGGPWDLPSGGGTVSTSSASTQISGAVTVTNVASFSPFTLASIVATPLSALPIRLISFTGKAINDVVQLNWETATETNNNYFEVLHSTDGSDFESIGKVKGNGTTNVAHNYSLIDHNPTLGKNYYRLKQVDFDGQTTSTEVILVNVLNVEPLASVFPNPASQGQLLNVKFNGLQANSSTELQIYNMQGVKVLNTTASIDAQGTLNTSILLSNLSTGLYILNVQDKYVKIIVE